MFFLNFSINRGGAKLEKEIEFYAKKYLFYRHKLLN
ncbi:hypothetical protein EV142_10439 [Flavobacterium circumlabens]|uniref:Uncharacterized protein n=1 Tax=Flavobacterium circumlabens TaxID=2133765 RepID=A0ABY2AYV5_9FLAO|nr:hypothetical protein EV142_10439 [Flavobacterium circumlabens]